MQREKPTKTRTSHDSRHIYGKPGIVFGVRDRGRVYRSVVGRSRRRVGHRRHAEDRVRGHDASTLGTIARKLAASAVPVSAAGGRDDARGARRPGPPDAQLPQRFHGVQGFHDPSPGHRRQRARHFSAGLFEPRRQRVPSSHDHLLQRQRGVRASGVFLNVFVFSFFFHAIRADTGKLLVPRKHVFRFFFDGFFSIILFQTKIVYGNSERIIFFF